MFVDQYFTGTSVYDTDHSFTAQKVEGIGAFKYL